MAFDSKDTAAFKDVWVFCEQRDGEIMSISHQLLSEGRKLADDLGVLVFVLKKVWTDVDPDIQVKARQRLSKWFDDDEIEEINELFTPEK